MYFQAMDLQCWNLSKLNRSQVSFSSYTCPLHPTSLQNHNSLFGPVSIPQYRGFTGYIPVLDKWGGVGRGEYLIHRTSVASVFCYVQIKYPILHIPQISQIAARTATLDLLNELSDTEAHTQGQRTNTLPLPMTAMLSLPERWFKESPE